MKFKHDSSYLNCEVLFIIRHNCLNRYATAYYEGVSNHTKRHAYTCSILKKYIFGRDDLNSQMNHLFCYGLIEKVPGGNLSLLEPFTMLFNR